MSQGSVKIISQLYSGRKIIMDWGKLLIMPLSKHHSWIISYPYAKIGEKLGF